MIKVTRARHYLLLLMTFFLVLGQLNLTTFKVLAKENGNGELTYEVQSELTGDKKSADLTIKVTPTKYQIKILTIETPDGKVGKAKKQAIQLKKMVPLIS